MDQGYVPALRGGEPRPPDRDFLEFGRETGGTMLALIATWFMGISLGTFFLHFFVLAFFLRPQDLKVRPAFL